MADAPPLPAAAAAAAATTTTTAVAAAATTTTTDASKAMKSVKSSAHKFCVAPCPVKGSKQPNPHTERDENVLVALRKVLRATTSPFFFPFFFVGGAYIIARHI